MKRIAVLAPSRAELVDIGAIVSLVSIAAYSFRSSYGGWQFLINAVLAAFVGAGAAHVSRKLRLHPLVAVVFTVVAYVLVCSLLALRRLNIAGVIPTPNSSLTALTKPYAGWKELVTTEPPVGYIGDLMAVPVFTAFVAATLGLIVAQRTRQTPVVLVFPFVVLGLGIATGLVDPVSLIVNGVVIAVGGIAWLATRAGRAREALSASKFNSRRLVSASAVLALAGSAGYLIAPSLPFSGDGDRQTWRPTVPPFDPRQYPSPLGGYRAYVKDGKFDQTTGRRLESKVMFTVEGLPEGVPVRLATMDTWDTLVWQVSSDSAHPSIDSSGSFRRVGASIEPDFSGEMAEVTIVIRDYNDVWVPDVGEVLTLRFAGSAGGQARDRQLADSLRYNLATDTAATPVRLASGDRYVMTVLLPKLAETMEGLTISAEGISVGVAEAPEEIVKAWNSPSIAAMETANEKLDGIAAKMRRGAYSDGDDNGHSQQARAGHGLERLIHFSGRYPVDPLVGNAEQYAATYALIARSLVNVSATRVVMGFKPQKASLDGPVDVVANDVEAWVEVPTAGDGWVMIEPTPDRDHNQAETAKLTDPDPNYRTQNPPPPPLVDPEFQQPSTVKGDAKTVSEPEEPVVDPPDLGPSAISKFVSSPLAIGVGVVASPFVALGFIACLIVLVKSARRRRRRARGEAHERIANGWREVTDLAVDMGRPVPDGTTRTEAAAFASPNSTVLAVKTDAAVWGGADLTDAAVDVYWAELVTTLKSMRRELGPIQRLKAKVSTRSLRRRENKGR